jgi:hypothetical protein
MSLTVTTDVFCDYPGCIQWEHGVTGVAVRGGDARRKVEQVGWVRRRFVSRSTSTVTVDLCPAHAGASREEVVR